MNAFAEGRFGRVFISKQLIEEAPADLRLLFANFVPISVHYNWAADRYEYGGYSDKFDALPEDECLEIPIYEALFKSEQDLLSSERIIRLLEFRRSS